MQPDRKSDFTDDRSATNRCLSALSAAATSLLLRHLTIVKAREGTALWAPGGSGTDVYFPLSGLISIGFIMANGECVEVGSIGRETCTGGVPNFANSGFPTQGSVSVAGNFARIPDAELARVAQESKEVKILLTMCRDWISMQAQQLAACNAVHSADRRFCRWLVQSSRCLDTATLHVTQVVRMR